MASEALHNWNSICYTRISKEMLLKPPKEKQNYCVNTKKTLKEIFKCLAPEIITRDLFPK